MIEQSSKEVADYMLTLSHEDFMKLLAEFANGPYAELWKTLPPKQEDTE